MTEPIQVPLGRGPYVALIDPADLPLITGYRWFRHALPTVTYARGYAIPHRVPTRWVYMHAVIAGPGMDHANRNGLDNTRANLRPATDSQNLANRGKQRRVTTSRFKGVYRNPWSWVAEITVDYRKRHLGSFAAEEDAARAYDAAAAEAWGEFARLNFP